MRILLTGANGFIGSNLLAGLEAAGHEVVPAVRDPAALNRPDLLAQRIDFNRDVNDADWLPRLVGIDVVINCAGVLQAALGQSMDAIHAQAPIALFKAAQATGIKRVIQISAISAMAEAKTDYASTKLAADEFLKSTPLDWVIVRPSLVYAPGAFGGTALLRALAALPCLIPVVGRGAQRFQPIHMDDVVACVVKLVDRPDMKRIVLDPVGPDTRTLREILLDLRAWLGYAPAPVFEVPRTLIAIAARIGDLFGSPLSTTALKQMEFGNTGDHAAYCAASGLRPMSWEKGLRAHPAQWQDRWHARLYFVRPLLRLMLAAMWLASGIVGLLYPPAIMNAIAASTALPPSMLATLALAGCVLDLAIGCLLLVRWRPNTMAAIQLFTIAAYTIFLTLALPLLWLDPFGPLLKNLPIATAILALAALEQDR